MKRFAPTIGFEWKTFGLSPVHNVAAVIRLRNWDDARIKISERLGETAHSMLRFSEGSPSIPIKSVSLIRAGDVMPGAAIAPIHTKPLKQVGVLQ